MQSVIEAIFFAPLWVLVRNMNNFIEYDKEITDFLNEYDFKYTAISQQDCK